MLLPGPPHELKVLFETECFPRLRTRIPPQHIATRILKMAMIPESQVDARVAPIYKTYNDVETRSLRAEVKLQLHLRCRKDSQADADARVEELAEKIEDELGDAIFSRKGETIEQIVSYLLQMRSMTLAVAESCTGGLLAERITSLSGSSRYFLGGAVVYSNELKNAICECSEDTDRPAWSGQPRSGGVRWLKASASAASRATESESPESQVRAAAPSRSPWAWCISRSREKKARRWSNAISPATASASRQFASQQALEMIPVGRCCKALLF